MANTQARKMVNLAIDETSGVDHPAHLDEGWLVIKSVNPTDLEGVLDDSLAEEESDMAYEAEAPETEQQVEKSADEVATLKKKVADLEAKLAESSKEEDGEVEKSLDPTEEFLKSAPESVVRMFESVRKEKDEAVAVLQKERDEKADSEAIAKAKGWANLNLDAEKMGPALRKMATIDPELAKQVETVFASLNAQAESANIFAELGKSMGGASGDALGQFTAMAKSMQEEGKATSFEDAMSKVALSNPELYRQYQAETKGA